MATINLDGQITESGELEVDMPDGLPAGEVEVIIKVDTDEPTQPQQSWLGIPQGSGAADWKKDLRNMLDKRRMW